MDFLTYACIFVSFTFSEGLQLLDSNILRYDPVYYNKQSLQSQHDQLQHASSTLYLNFYAYNRNFSLHLTRDRDPLTSNFDLRHKKKSTKADLSFIYSGSDEEYPGSIVEGAIIDGIFQGTIRLTGDTIYHVVPSHKVFVELPPFHSVIYSEHDYKWDAVYQHLKNHGQKMDNSNSKTGRSRHRRAVPAGEDPSLSNKICTLKLTSDHRMWTYLMGINNQNEDRTKNDIIFMLKSHVTELNYVYGHTVFTLNKGKVDEKKFSGVQFVIRAVDILTEADCMSDGKPTLDGICGINLPPDGKDGLLYRFADREFKSLFGGDTDYGTDYEEYNYDDYDKDTEYTDDIDYNADPVSVNGTEPVSVYNTTNNADDEYPAYHYDNEKSNDRPVGYCLSFLFTARILYSNDNPILGLSFAATPGQSGGVCQKDANNGFVTMFQYTDRAFLPSLVTKLVFAHEVSHAFGALHDNAKKCSPYNLKTEPEDGYYLMYSIAQRGVNPNNKLLSNCSVDTISAILTLPEYRQCFEKTAVPFCGNSIVEKGEECDCGMNATCTDICCNGKGHNPDRPDLDCKLKPKAQCSSSQGPCCDGHTCQLINRNESFVCQNEMPCVKKLFCNGAVFGAACPQPEAHQVSEDGFVCSANGRVCEAGSCNASICKMIGWRECQQSDSRDKLTVAEKEELCYVGCKKTKKSECISTHDYEKVHLYPELDMLLANVTEIIKHTKVAIQLPIGTPCNKMTGYCDVFHRCRGVNPDTVLVRIKNCIIGGQCMMQLKEFAQTYWLAILLVSIGSIIFFVIFVKLCAIHTKSSNPEVEMRYPRQTVRQSLKRVSNLRESVNMTNIRNSMNFSNFRQSFRGSFRGSSRPTSNEVDLKNMIKVDPDELKPLDPPLKNGT